MMFKTLLLLISSAFLVTSTTAMAQEDPIALSQEEQARIDAAFQLLDAIGYEAQVKKTMALSAPIFLKNAFDRSERDNNIEITDELREKFTNAVTETLDEISDEFAANTRVKAARVYADFFTLSELNRLTEINRDEVMKKFIRVAPDFTTKLIDIGITEMQTFSPIIEEKINLIIIDLFEKDRSQTA